jgi:hypothetical protein
MAPWLCIDQCMVSSGMGGSASMTTASRWARERIDV